ncbi:MAG: hypothetical protein ACHQ53_00295 [Polyangiales bacterium]
MSPARCRLGGLPALAVVLCALVVLGCQDTLPKATEIIRMRVLGSQVEVDGDPTRATPKPGEDSTVSFLTVFPKLSQTSSDVQTMLIGCTAPSRFSGGLPVCQEFLDAAANGGAANIGKALPAFKRRFHCSDLPASYAQFGTVSVQCLYEDPLAQLTVPLDYAAKQVLLLGVVCERGDAYVDPTDPQIFGCEHDSGETIRVNTLVTVQQKPDQANHNPSLDALTIRLDDGLWAAPPTMLPNETQCRSSADPQSGPTSNAADKGKPGQPLPLRDPGEHVIDLIYDAASRETDPTLHEPEDVEITVYDTVGKMERRFTVLAGTDKGTGKPAQIVGSVKWEGPGLHGGIPASGKLVRFFITLRDHRGGFSATSRALCLYAQ